MPMNDKEKLRVVHDKCQAILSQLLRDEDNKYCVDCDAKGPRWASWNLGIFMCIRCAGIHRNLGVHISRVKSVNLDTWTPEQVAYLQQMGNSRARAVYEANLPDNFRRPQTDSSLEAFIRAKYEQKKYIAKEWVPPPMPKPAFDVNETTKEKKERSRSKGTGLDPPGSSNMSVPKPKSRSPTSSPTPPPLAGPSKGADSNVKKSGNTEDLLGLDDPILGTAAIDAGDPFGSFLSAEPLPTTSNCSPRVGGGDLGNGGGSSSSIDAVGASVATDEEKSFFGLTTAEDVQKKQQLSKESILSLYAQNNSNAQSSANPVSAKTSTPQPQMFNMQGPMFVGQQGFPTQAMGFAGSPLGPAPGVNMLPNGIIGHAQPTGMISSGQPHPAQHGLVLGGSMGVTGMPVVPGSISNPFLNHGVLGPVFPTNMGHMAQPATGIGQHSNLYYLPDGQNRVIDATANTNNLMWAYRRRQELPSMHTTNPFYLQMFELQQHMAAMSLGRGSIVTGNVGSMIPQQSPVGIGMGVPMGVGVATGPTMMGMMSAGPQGLGVGVPVLTQPTGHAVSPNLWQ